MTTFFPPFGDDVVENHANFLTNANPLAFAARAFFFTQPEAIIAPLGILNEMILNGLATLPDGRMMVQEEITPGGNYDAANRPAITFLDLGILDSVVSMKCVPDDFVMAPINEVTGRARTVEVKLLGNATNPSAGDQFPEPQGESIVGLTFTAIAIGS